MDFSSFFSELERYNYVAPHPSLSMRKSAYANISPETSLTCRLTALCFHSFLSPTRGGRMQTDLKVGIYVTLLCPILDVSQ